MALKSEKETEKNAPFEVKEARKALKSFLDTPYPPDPNTKIGDYKCGVYAFYDYEDEPIYIGQTREGIRTRIRRHLTNQRTDAVAMSVLDPFEVRTVRVWPITELQGASTKDTTTLEHVNALERQITKACVEESKFKAVLNEKDPPPGEKTVPVPTFFSGKIVTDKVEELRGHIDTRIARRAQTIARLSQVIEEREVKGGLRRVLKVQAERLLYLTKRRYEALGGDSIVEQETSE